MLKLRYFASLRETLESPGEEIMLPEGVETLADLTHWLQARGPIWQQVLADRNVRAAVNHELALANCPVADGDEVAWFPPMTGG